MTPVNFPQANSQFQAPPGYDPSQVKTIPAHVGIAHGGSVDGSTLVIVAWKPEPYELERLNAGGCVYLSCIGGIPPHFLSTDFVSATHPA